MLVMVCLLAITNVLIGLGLPTVSGIKQGFKDQVATWRTPVGGVSVVSPPPIVMADGDLRPILHWFCGLFSLATVGVGILRWWYQRRWEDELVSELVHEVEGSPCATPSTQAIVQEPAYDWPLNEVMVETTMPIPQCTDHSTKESKGTKGVPKAMVLALVMAAKLKFILMEQSAANAAIVRDFMRTQAEEWRKKGGIWAGARDSDVLKARTVSAALFFTPTQTDILAAKMLRSTKHAQRVAAHGGFMPK